MYFYKNNDEVLIKTLSEEFVEYMNWSKDLPKPYGVEGSENLLEKIAFDMHKAITITAPGFYGPQGRELRLPLAHPNLNSLIEKFRYNGRKITNYEASNILVFILGIETRARFSRLEVMVSIDACIRVEDAQFVQKVQEGCTLCERASVLGCLAVAGTTANIADAD